MSGGKAAARRPPSPRIFVNLGRLSRRLRAFHCVFGAIVRCTAAWKPS
ncbi:MAG: hypothetical protein MZU95_02650 [Desulfomicrobium escambiense]|nr:hypothetical protein [Desulfomicrobium escambiense]